MKKIVTYTLALCVPACFLLAESFVIEKPQNVHTKSYKKLKQDCCDACAHAIECTCALIGSLNALQHQLLVDIREFLENEKSATLEKANKQQLAHVHARMKALEKQMQSLRAEIRQTSAYLKKI